MNHKLTATLSVALGSALILQGCKMDSTSKLALGVGAIGTVNALVSENKEKQEQAKIAEQQRAEDEKKRTELEEQEAKIKGNFGYTLGDVFNTNDCLKGTLKKSDCQVSLSGNTFFHKAYVAFHPETKEISKITGTTKPKKFTIPKNMYGNASTLSQKREMVDTKTTLYVYQQKELIFTGLKDAGVLPSDKEYDAGEIWIHDGDKKSIVLADVVTETNMANRFVPKPFKTVMLKLMYEDKYVTNEVKKHLQNEAEASRKAKLKGNF